MRAVSGHKCDDSLSLYQKVSDQTKIEMGMSLGHTLLHVPPVKQPLPAQVKAIQQAAPTAPTAALGAPPNAPAIMPAPQPVKYYQGRIQDFLLGGGANPHWRGRQPPTQVLFSDNICKNERIWSCWWGRAPETFVCRSAIDYHWKTRIHLKVMMTSQH